MPGHHSVIYLILLSFSVPLSSSTVIAEVLIPCAGYSPLLHYTGGAGCNFPAFFLSSCSQVLSSCPLPDCNPPLVPVSFILFTCYIFKHECILEQPSPLLEHWQKYLLIISQITPSALCVHQGKLWCLKACEQLTKHGLLINLTTIISMFPGTWSSSPILSALFAYDCQSLWTGHTVQFLYRVKKSSEEMLQNWAYTRLWLFKK